MAAQAPKPGFTFDPLPAPEALRYLEDRQLKPSFAKMSVLFIDAKTGAEVYRASASG